jgi:hypothetical protein
MENKVVVLREPCTAIMYTTEIINHVNKSQVRIWFTECCVS